LLRCGYLCTRNDIFGCVCDCKLLTYNSEYLALNAVSYVENSIVFLYIVLSLGVVVACDVVKIESPRINAIKSKNLFILKTHDIRVVFLLYAFISNQVKRFY
jgi:hypothetical protein